MMSDFLKSMYEYAVKNSGVSDVAVAITITGKKSNIFKNMAFRNDPVFPNYNPRSLLKGDESLDVVYGFLQEFRKYDENIFKDLNKNESDEVVEGRYTTRYIRESLRSFKDRTMKEPEYLMLNGFAERCRVSPSKEDFFWEFSSDVEDMEMNDIAINDYFDSNGLPSARIANC